MNKPLYQRLASTAQAWRNCVGTDNTEWRDRHAETIDNLVKQFMPSGSGWNAGTGYSLELWYDKMLQFHGSYHHMDEHGGYDGWTDHTIFVRPSFDGIELTITGLDRDEIKDYLYEMFDICLRQEISDDDYTRACGVEPSVVS